MDEKSEDLNNLCDHVLIDIESETNTHKVHWILRWGDHF